MAVCVMSLILAACVAACPAAALRVASRNSGSGVSIHDFNLPADGRARALTKAAA